MRSGCSLYSIFRISFTIFHFETLISLTLITISTGAAANDNNNSLSQLNNGLNSSIISDVCKQFLS